MKLNRKIIRAMIKEGLNEVAGGKVSLGSILDPDGMFFPVLEEVQVGLIRIGDNMEAAASRAYQQDNVSIGGDIGVDRPNDPAMFQFYNMANRRKKEMDAVRDFLSLMEFTNANQTLVEFLKGKGL